MFLTPSKQFCIEHNPIEASNCMIITPKYQSKNVLHEFRILQGIYSVLLRPFLSGAEPCANLMNVLFDVHGAWRLDVPEEITDLYAACYRNEVGLI